MSSRYTFILIILIIVLATLNCARRAYELKQEDFMLFPDPADAPVDNTPIRKFSEGIYLFKICSGPKVFEGVTTNWYHPCDEQIKDLRQYSFLAFLDDYRVYYFTETDQDFDAESQSRPNYCGPKVIDNTLEASDFMIKKRFNMNYDVDHKTMRGYYKLEDGYTDEKIKVARRESVFPYGIDSIEVPVRRYRILFEMEKITTKNKKITFSADLYVNIDPKAKDDYPNINRIQISKFTVRSKNAEIFRDAPMSESNRRVQYNTIYPEDVFLFPPTFRYVKQPIHYYWCEDERKSCFDSQRLYFDSIDYKPKEGVIDYWCKKENNLLMQERIGTPLSW